MNAFLCRLLLTLLFALLATASEPAMAEPVLDHALASAQIYNKNGCSVLKVNFNFRIRYASHFPLDRGDELWISIQPIDRAHATALLLLQREALRAPASKVGAIKAIDFEANQANGPALRIQFDHPVHYQVAQRGDFESITIAISGRAPSANCRPDFPADATDVVAIGRDAGERGKPGGPTRPKERSPGKISDADLRTIEGMMDEGRAALRKQGFERAASIFTKILKYPENPNSADAQEFLGTARQKLGQLGAARAEFEDYVTRYPSGDGNERVRQRLAGILTAMGDPGEKLRESKDQRAGKGDRERNFETIWTLSGSASSFYTRDDSYRTLRDPSLPPLPNEDKDLHRVNQNALLTSLDVIGTASNQSMKAKVRFSGTEEHSFSQNRDFYSVAAAFAEVNWLDWNTLGRAGRQTRNSGGVLGRFDGAFASWQYSPSVRFNVVGGSPVVSRRDQPFKDEKYFYGASVDLGPLWGGFETSLFFVEQRYKSMIDRQAVGAEFRYFDMDRSAFALVDYDTHFQQLNAALFSGSWTFADRSTFYGAADYRKSPYLTVWNALQGQSFLTLFDMLKIHTRKEIDQIALDRTTTYQSVMAGYSRPITETFMASADVTAVNVSGTPTSAGVLGSPAIGNEYYYSAQLIGTGIFAPGDMVIGGVRYADLWNSNLYVLDFSSRFPLLTDLRVSPRIRLGYREGKETDLREYTILPTILLNYNWTRDLNFELEVGSKWTSRQQAGVKETMTDLFLTVGVRYDFFLEHRGRCLPIMPGCQGARP
jgi:hypothetical protein